MSLQRLEKETIILYNDAEKIASIYTCNNTLQQKLKKIAVKFPKLFKLIDETAYAVTYEIPKDCIVIRQPYNEEYRQKARQRAYKQKLGYKKDT